MKLVEFYAGSLKECYEVIKLSEDMTLPAPLPAPLSATLSSTFQVLPQRPEQQSMRTAVRVLVS